MILVTQHKFQRWGADGCREAFRGTWPESVAMGSLTSVVMITPIGLTYKMFALLPSARPLMSFLLI
jgi:hypothetical protein